MYPQNCSVRFRGWRAVEEACFEVRAVELCLKESLLQGDKNHGFGDSRNPSSFPRHFHS